MKLILCKDANNKREHHQLHQKKTPDDTIIWESCYIYISTYRHRLCNLAQLLSAIKEKAHCISLKHKVSLSFGQ